MPDPTLIEKTEEVYGTVEGRKVLRKVFIVEWPTGAGDPFVPPLGNSRKWAMPQGMGRMPTLALCQPTFRADKLNAVLLDEKHMDDNPGDLPWDENYVYLMKADDNTASKAVVTVIDAYSAVR